MTAFVMDDASSAALRALAKYAEAHPIPLKEMRQRHDDFVAGRNTPPLPPEYSITLPLGYRVVFTIEEHPLKDGSGGQWLRHMSMSSPRNGKAPVGVVLEWVMGQLGYTTSLHGCMVYPEPTGENSVAMNVLGEYLAPASASEVAS